MFNKSDDFYFKNFSECAAIALDTAQMLCTIMDELGLNLLDRQLKLIHDIEHKGDVKHHELMSRITKDFITPLEREDIIELSNGIDDVTDAIEDIAIHMYINNEKTARPDCAEFGKLLIRICIKIKEMLEEFPNFRKSKTLIGLVEEIHHIEEEGDVIYTKAMRKLHTEEKNALTVIAWREIYSLFEKAYDYCALVADIVESVSIANT